MQDVIFEVKVSEKFPFGFIGYFIKIFNRERKKKTLKSSMHLVLDVQM